MIGSECVTETAGETIAGIYVYGSQFPVAIPLVHDLATALREYGSLFVVDGAPPMPELAGSDHESSNLLGATIVIGVKPLR